MNKTKIEWVQNPDGGQGYTHNPFTGCKNHTPEGLCLGGMFPCYAYRLANGRLKERYLANWDFGLSWADYIKIPKDELAKRQTDPFYPRFWSDRCNRKDMGPRGKPKGVFVCDMSDLFGIGIPEDWTHRVLDRCKDMPQHRFYLLTKQPQNLHRFSPFPDNCWVGVTGTNDSMIYSALGALRHIEAKIKYLSIEPFLRWDGHATYAFSTNEWRHWLDWLIIGACTGTEAEMEKLQNKYQGLSVIPYGNKWTAQPQISWVQEIVQAADQAGIPVFLKDNLKPILIEDAEHNLYSYPEWAGKQVAVTSDHKTPMRLLRQEMPK